MRSAEDQMAYDAGEEAPDICPEHGEETDEATGACLLCVDEAEAEIHREWDARYHMIASQRPIAFDDMAF